MKSPFPGMDPYLEAHWGDVHQSLITYLRDDLQERLPPGLRARMEESVYVEPDLERAERVRVIYPDVRVIEQTRGAGAALAVAEEIETAVPIVFEVADEPVTEGFIEIIDVESGNRVVTVIEILSLANKLPGAGRRQYRQKRQELEAGEVNLVEIDLLRRGKRDLAIPLKRIRPADRTTYLVCVSRAWGPHEAEVYRAPLREPLPAIRIPLRETDADVPLRLQSLIDSAYHHGRYDDIDYRADPKPPLTADDAKWADELLKSKGQR